MDIEEMTQIAENFRARESLTKRPREEDETTHHLGICAATRRKSRAVAIPHKKGDSMSFSVPNRRVNEEEGKSVEDSEGPEVEDQAIYHPVENCSVSRRKSRTELTPQQGDFLGSLVPTPRVVNEQGEVIPPVNWARSPQYKAIWGVDFSIPEGDPIAYNKKVQDVADVAWLISGINHVKVAVWESEVLELVNLQWKPTWVPLQMVHLDSSRIEQQLSAQRKRYEVLGSAAKFGLRKTIPGHVKRVLALYHLNDQETFMIQQITKFAVITIPELGENIDVVKADFKRTYEHSSVLYKNNELWKELCARRIESAKKCLPVASLDDQKVISEFVERCEKEIA
jgi:hypothetical protein